MIQILSSFHAKECHDLHRQCFAKEWSCDEFIDFFDNDLMIMFGYWYQDQLIGLLVTSIIGHEAEIYTLCTHPDYRGKKIASQLIDVIKQECHARLVTDIFLDVAIDNKPALKCYRKHNFKMINTRKNYYMINNTYRDAFTMRLGL